MRELAKIAKAAVNAASSQSVRSTLVPPLRYSRAEVRGIDPIAASYLPTSLSLIADLEVEARRREVPLKITPLQLNGATVATVYCIERRFGGVPTWLHHGVVVLAARWEPGLLSWLCHRLQDFAVSDVATYGIIGPGMAQLGEERAIVSNRSVAAVIVPRNFQEVLPLRPQVAELARGFGRSTRRRILLGLDYAERHELGFHFAANEKLCTPWQLWRLAQGSQDRRAHARTRNAERYLATQPHAFYASLAAADGRLVGAAGGFIADDLAVIAYQLSHAQHRDAYAALTLRFLLAEHLIEQGVSRIAFSGNRADSLRRYCERVPGAELLLLRNSVAARVKLAACAFAWPRGDIARLGAHLDPNSDMQDRDGVVSRDAKHFEQARSELESAAPLREKQ